MGARQSYFGHPEWEALAPGLKSIEDATEIRRRGLLALERAERETDPLERAALLTFVVVGGGPGGVELAGALAEVGRQTLARDYRVIDPRQDRVIVLERGPRILATFPEDLARNAQRALQALGVDGMTSTSSIGCSSRSADATRPVWVRTTSGARSWASRAGSSTTATWATSPPSGEVRPSPTSGGCTCRASSPGWSGAVSIFTTWSVSSNACS